MPKRRGVFGTDLLDDHEEVARFRFADYLDSLSAAAPALPVAAEGVAMDSGSDGFDAKMAFRNSGNSINEMLALWYARQGFIGHQLCATLAQNWLINKACSRPAEDALRHGYRIVEESGAALPGGVMNALLAADKALKIKKALFQYLRAGRVFGLAFAVFRVDSKDPEFYECPFNPDAVKPGSYQGVSIVEPYWCTPLLDKVTSSDPSHPSFYEPTWWIIGGRRYHRSHLCVFRQDEISDILKPAYFYGGVPIPQKILERVYAAERTANEAPALAMNKRTTVFKTDVERAFANMEQFQQNLDLWVKFRDNHSIKIADKETEDMAQFDTTLTDFDTVMMSQYQLVAAAADIPATKLLGTTPKGFNATGEYEESSYHETLESIQEHDATPFLEKHHQLVLLSQPELGAASTTILWNPTDSQTAKERADILKTKADAYGVLLDAGVVEAGEVRKMLQIEGVIELTEPPEQSAPDDADLAGMAQQLDDMAQALGLPPDEGAGASLGEMAGQLDQMAAALGGDANDSAGGVHAGLKARLDKMLSDLSGNDLGALKAKVDGLAAAVGMDAEPQGWITINGAAVPVGADGQPAGKVGEKLKAAGSDGPTHVELSGKEFGEGEDTKELRKAALAHAKTHFVGKPPITNANSGHPIKVTWQGMKHSLAGANIMEVRLAAGLPQMLEHAEYQGASPSKPGQSHIKAAHKYLATAKVGGERLHVGIVTHEKWDGHEHYDHFIVSHK